jgi:antitoxin YefM
MPYIVASENLASTMGRICTDHDPVIITRNRDQSVVMLSLDDYESLQETAYLMSYPANAKRLIVSSESLNAGDTVRKRLKDSARAGRDLRWCKCWPRCLRGMPRFGGRKAARSWIYSFSLEAGAWVSSSRRPMRHG